MLICKRELQLLTFQRGIVHGSNKKIKVPCSLHICIYGHMSVAKTLAEKKKKAVAIFLKHKKDQL